MKFTLEFFTNDKFKILKILENNQIAIKEDIYIPLSQQEIADIAHFSKLKTNKILNELKENEFIDLFNSKRGKYYITEKGHKVLQLMKEER